MIVVPLVFILASETNVGESLEYIAPHSQ